MRYTYYRRRSLSGVRYSNQAILGTRIQSQPHWWTHRFCWGISLSVPYRHCMSVWYSNLPWSTGVAIYGIADKPAGWLATDTVRAQVGIPYTTVLYYCMSWDEIWIGLGIHAMRYHTVLLLLFSFWPFQRFILLLSMTTWPRQRFLSDAEQNGYRLQKFMKLSDSCIGALVSGLTPGFVF